MAQKVQISCINKTARFDPHERISHIGGLNTDSTRWRLTLLQAITGIENGTWDFYVSTGGHTVRVIIATRLGNKYLKTKNDGDSPDNLLSLPECPQ